MSFPRYPSYKPSGVEWLGEVPSHWETSRMKNLFALMNRMPEEEDGIVTAFRDGEVTLRNNRRVDGFTNAIHEHGYQRILKGDLVIHAMDAFAGAIGVSDSDGKSSPVYSACTPKSSQVHPPYYGRLLRHMAMMGFINALSKGIRERSTEFRWKEASNVVVAAPPLAEQTAIAEFLDRETGKIDALVAEQRRLMELLKEKRQAVISHAVTQGLNPKAPMKDSGIDWIGELPTHWSAQPLFLRYQAVLGKMVDEKQKTGEHPVSYLRNADVNWDRINITDLPTFDVAPEEEERCLLRAGDLLICEGGAGVGQTSIWQGELERCAFQKALHRLRPWSNNEVPRFLYYCMRYAVESGVVLAGGTATIPHLTGEQLRRYRFPCPPVEEQHQIVAFLDSEAKKFDTLTAEAQRAIDLLQERRTALISAAVTGQIDVRGLAPISLPDPALHPHPPLHGRVPGAEAMEAFWRSGDPADLPENPAVAVVMDWLNRLATPQGFEPLLARLGLTHPQVMDTILQPAENGDFRPMEQAHPLVLMHCLWRIGVQIERGGYDDLSAPVSERPDAGLNVFWATLRRKLLTKDCQPPLVFERGGSNSASSGSPQPRAAEHPSEAAPVP